MMAIPLATYRLQLAGAFDFDAAAAIVPYLQRLGVSHLYASPFLKARAGSSHGYDITDHAAFNPEFGGEAGFLRLSDALRTAGIGLILDFVPNHMGIGHSDNAWWRDVLEWGQDSPYARVFDISWNLLPYRRGGGVLVPVLGRPYGEALEAGEIELKYDPARGSFAAWYFDHEFPIHPPRYGEILKTVLQAAHGEDSTAGRALLALAQTFPHPRAPSYQEAPGYKRDIAAIADGADLIGRGLAALRADPGGFAPWLHRLLERQHYRLAYWRVAVSNINFRRFFDINDLAGIRIEDPTTFRLVHPLVLRLIAEGRLQGLRLDHIDGLRDPLQYARRLRRAIGPHRPGGNGPFHTVVEKILGPGETLPGFDGVAGTTGYERLNLIARVLVRGDELADLEATWRAFTGERRSFDDILESAKDRVLDTMLASEFHVLTQILARVASGHYSTRDHTEDRLRRALRAYVIKFPIYRTYVTPAGTTAADRDVIARTLTAARRSWTGSDPDIFEFLYEAITLDLLRDRRAYSGPRVTEFALRLQQFTGPLTAKALEDTTFYRHLRLIALNEVGGHPQLGGVSVSDFHDAIKVQAGRFRHGLTATATHDTKRGEDARLRILALAELVDDWRGAVATWREMNRPVRADGAAPSLAHEYLLYQTLIGAWPLDHAPDGDFTARIDAYALKAAREGKEQTSWVNPNEDYERALSGFVRALLDPARSAAFLHSFDAFARRTALIGALNSLSQLVLKATLPGVPDFYQGSEFWDLALVDPDNRRPVDFAARAAALDAAGALDDLTARWPDGRIKLFLTHRLLKLRQAHRDLFEKGSYTPIAVTGRDAGHVVAYTLSHRRRHVVIAAARHFAAATRRGTHWPQGGFDAALALEPGGQTFEDVFTGETTRWLDLNFLFARLPAAVLLRRD